jgi:hypothetical protein
MSRTPVFERHARFRPDRKNETGEYQSQEHVHHFDIKGIVYKEFVLAGQTVNFAYYCDVLRQLRKNVQRLLPKLWRQTNWLLHHDNAPFHTSFSLENFFTKNNVAVVPNPEHLSLFPRLRIN